MAIKTQISLFGEINPTHRVTYGHSSVCKRRNFFIVICFDNNLIKHDLAGAQFVPVILSSVCVEIHALIINWKCLDLMSQRQSTLHLSRSFDFSSPVLGVINNFFLALSPQKKTVLKWAFRSGSHGTSSSVRCVILMGLQNV